MKISILTHFDRAEFQRIASGYTSPDRYRVSKTESLDRIDISLQREPLAEPFVKTWQVLDEDIERYERMVGEGRCLGAWEDGRLVGLAIAELVRWNRTLVVWELHAQREQRGQGIGRALIEALAEIGRKEVLRALVVETQNTNARAVEFYFKNGFTLDGVDLSLYTNEDLESGEVALFFKRWLVS